MLSKLKFILIFLFVFSFLFGNDLEFFREDLNFKIKDNYFYVDGIYFFKNQTSKKIKRVLFYPFPTDSIFGTVDSIKAICLKDSLNKILNSKPNGFLFCVEIESKHIGKYNLCYRQKLLSNKAEYILTTTQLWQKPFEEVNYQLIIPQYIKIDSLSYLPDNVKTVENKCIFYWHKENFMPSKNMIILLNRN